MKKEVDLVFCKKGKAGSGATTAAAHLAKGLKSAGYRPRVWVIDDGRKSGRDNVEFEKGLRVNIRGAKAFLMETKRGAYPPIIACAFPPIPQLGDILSSKRSAVLWIHGKEVNKPALEYYKESKYPTIIVRPATVEWFPEGWETVFLPHPYQPLYTQDERKERRLRLSQGDYKYHAVCHARLTSVKRTDVIVRANRKLAKDKRVHLWGFDNRLYSHFTLDNKFGSTWRKRYHGELPGLLHAGADLCSKAKYVVDLSAYKYDGGGTQYTFLEAWDAGVRLICNANWLHKGNTNWNLIKGAAIWAKPTPKGLIKCLNEKMPDEVWRQIYQKGDALIREHDAKRVAKMFVAYLEQL